MEKVNKILIFRTEHIGDYIVSLPAIKLLRNNFPKAQIDIVVGSWNKDLAEATPYVDNIILFDNPFVKRNLNYLDLLKILFFNSTKIRKFIKIVNKKEYDLIIMLSNRKFNKLYKILFNAKEKIWGDKWDERLSQSENCIKVLESYGLKRKIEPVFLKASRKEIRKINDILNKYSLENKNIIYIHAVSPLEERNWQPEKWKKITQMILNKDKDAAIVFIGDSNQKQKIEEILIKNKRAINLAGELSLVQLFLLFKKNSIFLGLCSGPIFIANLAKIPIIGLYGKGTNSSWGPSGKNTHTIRKNNVKEIGLKEVWDAYKKSANQSFFK